VNGTVQEVVSKHVAGSPAGMHILVANSKSIVDAHLGPFLTKGTQEALHTETPVEIVGAVETIHGKEYLLAPQLILGGRTVTVRSEKGFLVRAYSPRVAHSKPRIGPGSDGTCNAGTGSGQEVLDVTLISNTKGLPTEYDSWATSNGTLDLQSASLETSSGGYAFFLNLDQQPLAIGGVVNVDSSGGAGGISGAGSVFDINDLGTSYVHQLLNRRALCPLRTNSGS